MRYRNIDPSSVWRSARLPILLSLGTFVGLVLVITIGALFGIPVEDITPDVAAVAGVDFYAGILSQAGIIAWAAGSSIALFTGFVLRSHDPKRAKALIALGSVSAALGLDDAFMLHEQAISGLLGIPELAVIGALVISMLVVVYLNRSILVQYPLGLAIGAGVYFAFALAADVVFGHNLLLEDGFKYLGLALWLGYLVQLSYLMVGAQRSAKALASQPPGDQPPSLPLRA